MNTKEIEQYLIDTERKEIPALLPRDVVIPPTPKIKALIGPRRAGKTFYLYQLAQKLRNEHRKIVFLNFENTKLLGLQFKEIREVIDIYRQLYSPESSTKPVLILDEPQNVDLWERAVRELFDEGYNIFISGSSSKLLSKEIFTSLRGRSLSYLLLPFSFKEFLRAKQHTPDTKLSSEEKLQIASLLREYLEFGGFPEVVIEQNSEQKIKNLESYFELTVYKDMVERYKLRDSALMKWFLKAIASSYTKEVSINKIYLTLKSQGRKISKDELYSYSSIVEDSLFAFYLPKFSVSVRKRDPLHKIYLCDVGFAKLLETEKDIGKKMENVVFLELLRRKSPTTEYFFWKNQQKEEVDFVVKEGIKIKELIQVCKDISNKETKQREVRALLKASKALRCNHLFLLTEEYEGEKEEQWLDFKGRIVYVPVWKWLLQKD